MTPTTLTEDRRPMAYFWTTWHLLSQPRTLVAPRVLAELERATGSVPAALDSEAGLYAFANAADIVLVDADVEPHIVLPNQRYPSRDWVRDLYARFIAWAIKEDWLRPPVAGPVEDLVG